MSLTALTWKQLPVQSLAASYTIVQLLDAIYTAMTSTTYVDGSTRTPGSGIAWTFSRYQNAGTTEAVYGNPPTNPLTQKIIFAGATTTPSPSPTMATSMPVYATNTAYIGLAKNAGNFNTWQAASPFTSGQFSGYVGFHLRGSALAIQLRIYESADGLVGVINSTTSTVSSWFLAGGLIDPETGDTLVDAESDGKLYCVGGSQQSTFNTASNISPYVAANGSAAALAFAHKYSFASGAAISRMLAFTPGSATLLGLSRNFRYTAVGTTLQSRSGKYAKLPITVAITDSASGTYTDPPITHGGRLREIWGVRSAISGTTLRNSGTDIGYFISDSVLSAPSGGAILLSA